ncbi:hypothetical protein BCR42DRAFT_417608 [Absidia repens]|uniref:Tudor domain-containing protein n=1 Tax=Absidia repens TaxID=90262 RepID=A0A1X2IE54_9FUNG|nr:hypothetical protein BCR42DRAFT_417608 [Absidia repens]
MSENETELYQFQLEQVEHALSSDPTNEELLKLQTDLKELIALTTQYEQVSTTTTQSSSNHADPPNNSNSNNNINASPVATETNTRKRSRSPSTTPAPRASALVSQQFSVGQDVKAKWSQDGQYYRATITAIGGADQIFSVQFRGYKDIEVVSVADIEPLEKDKRKGIFEDIKTMPGVDSEGNYNNNNVGVSVGDDGTTNSSNKKKKVKKVSEVEVKKNAWLDFAKGGDKKKKKQKVVPINKKSIFRTPDNPESKVGVVGSGRGMTSYQQRGKHSFGNALDDQ